MVLQTIDINHIFMILFCVYMLFIYDICIFPLFSDWNVFQPQLNFEQSYHQQIIRWFGDHAGTQSPFSLHRLVVFGEQYGKKPGDWYGPSSVANILK